LPDFVDDISTYCHIMYVLLFSAATNQWYNTHAQKAVGNRFASELLSLVIKRQSPQGANEASQVVVLNEVM